MQILCQETWTVLKSIHLIRMYWPILHYFQALPFGHPSRCLKIPDSVIRIFFSLSLRNSEKEVRECKLVTEKNKIKNSLEEYSTRHVINLLFLFAKHHVSTSNNLKACFRPQHTHWRMKGNVNCLTSTKKKIIGMTQTLTTRFPSLQKITSNHNYVNTW